MDFEVKKEECENTSAPLPEYKVTDRGILVCCYPCEKYIELARKYSITDENVPIKTVERLNAKFKGKRLERIKEIIDLILKKMGFR